MKSEDRLEKRADLEYDVLVKEKKQNYAGTFTMGIARGVVFCIVSVIPLLIIFSPKTPKKS